MKLLEVDSTIKLLGVSSVFDSDGLASDYFTITPNSTAIDCEILSSRVSTSNTFVNEIEIIISTEETLALGENIFFTIDDFPVEAWVTSIGTDNKYKLIANYTEVFTIGDSTFYFDRDIVEIDAETPEGLYYSNSGELLIVGKGFKIWSLVDINNIKALKPAIKNQLSDWQIHKQILVAYNLVMMDLSSWEVEFAEKYEFLEVDSIVKMIEYRVISIIEEGGEMINSDLIFTKKYISTLNNYRPKYKVKDGIITPTSGGRIKW